VKVCAVTCTGGRPETFALCRRWIANQTRRIDEHIVVDDFGSGNGTAVPQMPDTFQPNNQHPRPTWALAFALLLVPRGHAVFVMEDDDWYAPWYVENAMRFLKAGRPITYCSEYVVAHVPSGYWSGFRKTRMCYEGMVCLHPKFVDQFREDLIAMRDHTKHEHAHSGIGSVQIKGFGEGLTGRAGVSAWHREEHFRKQGCVIDPDFTSLRLLMGDDIEAYRRLIA
jgi:hypothetical protein